MQAIANRTATVLFAEPSSETKRNEISRKALAEVVAGIADATGGRVVKTVGGKLMVVFASPDAAASAASKIQAKMDALPPVGGVKIGVHIGFHSGPVFTGGMADDTVKLALRLVEQARDGQTVTSQKTAEQLNPAFRPFSSPLRSRDPAAEPIALCEVASWHQRGVRPQGWTAMALLRITCGDQLAVCSREKELIVIGRDDDCDLVIAGLAASRKHCTIEHRGGEFVIRDHSSNGTYVTAEQKSEIALHNERLSLPEEGVISIGEPRDRSSEPIEFCYALVT
jgi:adenylate cyclase